jgi:predicted transcriptional regulator
MTDSAKVAARRILECLPDDASMEDIMYALYFRQQVEEGIADSDAGRTVPHNEVVRELAEWQRSAGR